MATFTIQSPEGATYTVTAPDGVSEQDVMTQVQAQHDYHTQRLAQANADLEAAQHTDPSANSSFGQNLAEGAGKVITDLGRGAKQYALGVADLVAPRSPTLSSLVTGQPTSRVDEYRQQIAAQRVKDAPLMNTAGGKIGGIAGGALVTLPAMAIPGANTVAGATLLGGAYGALQPSTSTGETLTNIGLGAATGGLAQYGGQKLGSAISSRLASRSAAAADEQSANAARDAVLKTSQDAGYVVPPTAVKGGAVNTALESIGGKAAVRQQADVVNQKVTNGLIAKDLGLPDNAPITREALQQVRTQAGQIYGQIRSLGKLPSDAQYARDLQDILGAGQDLEKAYPGIGAQTADKVRELVASLSTDSHDANAAVSAFKYLNEQAKANYKSAFAQGGNSQSLELAKAQSSAASAIGDLIQRDLQESGQGDLAQAWQQARTTIAKTYTAENALKGNNINAANLAQQLRKGKPLSGGFQTVADFADHFGEVTRLPKSGAGVSKLGAYVGVGGAAYSLAHGNVPAALASLSLPAASYGVRNALLSRGGQSLLATPSYAPSVIGTGALNGLGYLGRNAPGLLLPTQNALAQPAR